MSARHSAVVTIRRDAINADGIGQITAQVRLHWPAGTGIDDLAAVAATAVDDALRLARIGDRS